MTVSKARRLRKEMTEAEKKLWKLIQSRAFSRWKFRRQHPIGRYIADFACVEALLVIEVDGGQHNDSTYDVQRTTWIESCGWRVVRFWNNEVMQNLEGVANRISHYLNTLTLPSLQDGPLPLPSGRGQDRAR